jgi:hypothetical protein
LIVEIVENYRHCNDSGKAVELDIFLPNEGLAFEYQGEQHYEDKYLLGSQWQQKQRDNAKKEICQMGGITLIEVPYWWDKQIPSLVGTIHEMCADLLLDRVGGLPIPAQPIGDIISGSQGLLTR